jgi:hypothetical protein
MKRTNSNLACFRLQPMIETINDRAERKFGLRYRFERRAVGVDCTPFAGCKVRRETANNGPTTDRRRGAVPREDGMPLATPAARVPAVADRLRVFYDVARSRRAATGDARAAFSLSSTACWPPALPECRDHRQSERANRQDGRRTRLRWREARQGSQASSRRRQLGPANRGRCDSGERSRHEGRSTRALSSETVFAGASAQKASCRRGLSGSTVRELRALPIQGRRDHVWQPRYADQDISTRLATLGGRAFIRLALRLPSADYRLRASYPQQSSHDLSRRDQVDAESIGRYVVGGEA